MFSKNTVEPLSDDGDDELRNEYLTAIPIKTRGGKMPRLLREVRCWIGDNHWEGVVTELLSVQFVFVDMTGLSRTCLFTERWEYID